MANTIKVKKLSEFAVVPFYSREGDAAFDLVSAENHIIAPQCSAMVGTGLAFEIPTGYEVEICPRSGISAKTPVRVANAPGTIDENYRGEIKVILNNTIQQLHTYEYGELNKRKDLMCDFVIDLSGENVPLSSLSNLCDLKEVPYPSFLIIKGDKIAQGKLREVNKATFEIVENLSETIRGDKGFGSSGKSV